MYKRYFLNFTAAVLSFGIADLALAHSTLTESGTALGIDCANAKDFADIAISRHGLVHIITSQHVGKYKKVSDREYLVDWSITGYDMLDHYDADHVHTPKGDKTPR